MLVRAAILAGVLAAPAVGGAQASGSAAWPGAGHVSALAITLHDEVRDGCWPRPVATQEAVELVFRSAGLTVAIDGAAVLEVTAAVARLQARQADATSPVEWEHVFSISAIGYESPGRPGLCAVSLRMDLVRLEPLYQRQEAGLVQYGWHGGLLTGHKSRMQGHITEHVTEAATSLANAVLRSRALLEKGELQAPEEGMSLEQQRELAMERARQRLEAARRRSEAEAEAEKAVSSDN